MHLEGSSDRKATVAFDEKVDVAPNFFPDCPDRGTGLAQQRFGDLAPARPEGVENLSAV